MRTSLEVCPSPVVFGSTSLAFPTLTRWLGVALAGLVATSMATDANAGGFTPWGGGTGDQTVALSPYLFVGGDGTTTLAPYLFMGATDHFDVMVGYSFSVDPNPDTPGSEFSTGAIEVMPRLIINNNAIFALHALYAPGADDAVLGLEFHGLAGSDFFGITYNAGWWPSIGGEAGFDSGDVYALLVPEFFVTDRFSIFAEFNPGVTVDNDVGDPEFYASVVPGVTVYVDKDLKHSVTAAATLSVAPEWGGATFGLLYWTDFDISKKTRTSKRKHRGSAGQETPARSDMLL